MDTAVIVAGISFFGTLLGTAGGIIASAKLTDYRLGQLEKKVEAQSKAYSRLPLIEERITNISQRLYIVEQREGSYFAQTFTEQ